MNRKICDLCGATIDETNTRYKLDKRYFTFDERKGRFKVSKTYSFARIDISKTETLDICEDCIKKIEEERRKKE